ncbi:MAG: hypothetical protein QG628_377 [Patescibacteria group bacterium]|nr:hypothetical protein [Patescibacteria group bacterium]
MFRKAVNIAEIIFMYLLLLQGFLCYSKTVNITLML